MNTRRVLSRAVAFALLGVAMAVALGEPPIRQEPEPGIAAPAAAAGTVVEEEHNHNQVLL